jgi:hypothetical protein
MFAALETTPMCDRHSGEWKAKDRALAEMLGLEIEWICSCASVTDRAAPSLSPQRPAEHDRLRVYEVRQALIAALGSGKRQTAPEGPGAAVGAV